MNHGQSNSNIKPSTVIKSQSNEQHSHDSNNSQTDATTKIITVKKTSLTKETISPWTPKKKLNLQDNSERIMNPSSTQNKSVSSYPVFFWEVLMTVALLVMALWMQGLPARQVPQNTNSETVPSFEITDPGIRF